MINKAPIPLNISDTITFQYIPPKIDTVICIHTYHCAFKTRRWGRDGDEIGNIFTNSSIFPYTSSQF